MKYLGGKVRLRKHIAPILREYLHDMNGYIEPFVGGAAVMEVISHPIRIGCDIHQDLIQMWQALQRGWEPPKIVTEEDYKAARDSDSFPPHLRAFIGFCCSFGGKWFAGYARNSLNHNYALSGYNALMRSIDNLRDVSFQVQDYRDLKAANSLIYCDPPYSDTTGYKSTKAFNHSEFWDWASDMSKDNIVVVSEQTAPSSFKSIWTKELKRSLGRKRAVEQLFVHESLPDMPGNNRDIHLHGGEIT